MTVSLEIMNKNMIDGQLKPMGINDPIILEAFKNIPRELFVDKDKSSFSYYEGNILIGGTSEEIIESEEAKRVYLGSEFNI